MVQKKVTNTEWSVFVIVIGLAFKRAWEYFSFKKQTICLIVHRNNFFFLYYGHINGHIKVIKYYLSFLLKSVFTGRFFQYEVYLLYGTVQVKSDVVRKHTIHPLQVNCKTEIQTTAPAKGLFWEPSWTSCSAKGLGILLSLVSDPKLQITKIAVYVFVRHKNQKWDCWMLIQTPLQIWQTNCISKW